MTPLKYHRTPFINPTVRWILTNRSWSLLSGPLSIFFIITFLSKETQGIWYTFLNLSMLTVFAELGFTVLIAQRVSHEFAFLELKNGYVVGDRQQLDHLFSLIRHSFKLYSLIIPIAITILIVIGYYWFGNQENIIFIAWVTYSIISGINLIVALLQSVYEGLNKIADIQKNMLFGSVLRTLFTWFLLVSGFGIWALVMASALSLMLMSYLLFRISPRFWTQIFKHEIIDKHEWSRELIPLQLRYAISWISGYFIFQLLVPVTFKLKGAVLAGQLGLTMTIISFITSSSNAWLYSKIPEMNMLVAKNETRELLSLFWNNYFKGLIFYLMGGGFFLVIIIIIDHFNFYADRFIGYISVVVLLLINVAYLTLSSLAMYLRSHKKEPFYLLSVVQAILMSFSILYLMTNYSLNIVLVSICFIYWLIILPLGSLIFMKYRRADLMYL